MTRWRWCIMLGLCVLLLAADVALKWYTYHMIPAMDWMHPFYPYGGIPVFKDFLGIDLSLNYVMNKGAAWGVLAEFQQQLLYARFFIVGALLVYLVMAALPFSKRIGFSLILTGAIGNMVDFFLYRHVVDMFHFNFWGYSFPVFNVADAAICLGVLLLIGGGLLGRKASSPRGA
ncbi:MAG: signal peptidase II [Chlamydiae bacterium]|nr:signal peptidase II [Chlamydiota bacterium]